MRTAKGISLTELLVIVAGVCLLAAIVTPRMIQLGIQSDVALARTQNAQIAAALEAYRVDNTGYPTVCEAILPNLLSTPVAYIPELPLDPFRDLQFVEDSFPFVSDTAAYLRHGIESSACLLQPPLPDFFEENHGPWWLYSVGPGRQLGPQGANPASLSFVYDPTNGTNSLGYIQLSYLTYTAEPDPDDLWLVE